MNRGNKGFIGIIVVIIIGLAALKYFFNWSIFDALGSSQGQVTVSYLQDIFSHVKDWVLQLWSYIH